MEHGLHPRHYSWLATRSSSPKREPHMMLVTYLYLMHLQSVIPLVAVEMYCIETRYLWICILTKKLNQTQNKQIKWVSKSNRVGIIVKISSSEPVS